MQLTEYRKIKVLVTNQIPFCKLLMFLHVTTRVEALFIHSWRYLVKSTPLLGNLSYVGWLRSGSIPLGFLICNLLHIFLYTQVSFHYIYFFLFVRKPINIIYHSLSFSRKCGNQNSEYNTWISSSMEWSQSNEFNTIYEKILNILGYTAHLLYKLFKNIN